MILYYLYIEEYNILKNVEMNFHANHRFSYNPRKKLLCKCRTSQKIPKGFFTLATSIRNTTELGNNVELGLDGGNACDLNPVDAVSIIIGDNGAGKTSVAAAISEIILGIYRGPFVMVYEVAPGEIVYASSVNNIKTKLRRVHHGGGAGYGFVFCYHSPHFVPYSVIRSDNDRVGDISSSNFVLKEANVLKYEDEETRRLYEFLAFAARENGWLSSLFGVNEPLGIAISRNNEVLTTARAWVESKITADKLIGTEELRHIRMVLSYEYEDPISKAFVLIMSLYWQKNYASAMNGGGGQFKSQLEFCRQLAKPISASVQDVIQKDIVARKWNSIIEYAKGPEGRRIATCLSCGCADEDKQSRLVKFLCAMREVFVHCQWQTASENKTRKALTTIFNPRVTINQMAVCLQLVRAHADLGEQTRVLHFGVHPCMSAGERSFLALWARLYEWATKYHQFNRNCLVFLDEAETTLHPALQCRLVGDMLLFFEHLFPNMHIHIVFSTHSPNLLSDIPVENVVFLRRYSEQNIFDNEPKTTCIDSSSLPETFGSNIFDLYFKHFKLTKGPIGSFARSKIEKLFDKTTLDKGSDERVLDLIGDDFIRGYLLMRGGHDEHAED